MSYHLILMMAQFVPAVNELAVARNSAGVTAYAWANSGIVYLNYNSTCPTAGAPGIPIGSGQRVDIDLDDAGNCAVVWEDGPGQIYCHTYTPTGLLISNLTASLNSGLDKRKPRVTISRSGGRILVCYNEGESGTIFGRFIGGSSSNTFRVNGTGVDPLNPPGSAVPENQPGQASYWIGGLSMDDSDRCYVAYMRYTGTAGRVGVCLKAYDAVAPAISFDEVMVETLSGYPWYYFCDVSAYDNNEGCVVAFTKSIGYSSSALCAKRFTSSGVFVSGTSRFLPSLTSPDCKANPTATAQIWSFNQQPVSVAANRAVPGNYIVTIQARNGTVSTSGYIKSCLDDWPGTITCVTLVSNNYCLEQHRYPCTACDDFGCAVIAYEDQVANNNPPACTPVSPLIYKCIQVALCGGSCP